MSIYSANTSHLETYNIVDGWLSAARRVASPNFNERPDCNDISLLVIHNISLPPEQFGGGYIERFFCNQLDASVHPYFKKIADIQVSSHLLITREGEILQFLPFNKRAWHAGRSSFDGREECNDYSIGIELEGADNIPFSRIQYAVLAEVSKVLMKTYSAIKKESIVGHSDIAPNRKTDPGPAFNWSFFYESLGVD